MSKIKFDAKKIRKSVAVLLLVLALASITNSQSKSKSASGYADSLVNAGSGQVQVSILHPLGWLVAFVLKNPVVYPINQSSAVVSVLLPVILGILTPLWEMLILMNGIYFVWGARDPASRNAAKQRVIHLVVGMILCGLSAPIFQMILDIERSLSAQVMSIGGISSGQMVAGYAMGIVVATLVVLLLKVIAGTWGMALCPVLVMIAMPFIALGLRYIAVLIFAMLFPVMIFLYFFDFTKKLGSKLFRTAMLWVSVPIVQAIFIVVMVEGMQAAAKMSLTGGFIALASFVMIGVVPFMMEGMMGSIGGALIHSGYTTNNSTLVMIGAFVSGQGPSAFTTYAWYANQAMRGPIGGDYVDQARAAQLEGDKAKDSGVPTTPPIPATGGFSLGVGSRHEQSAVDQRIQELENQGRALRTSLGGAPAGALAAIDREISELKKGRGLAASVYTPDEIMREISEKKAKGEMNSAEDLRKYLGDSTVGRALMWRLLREQQAGRFTDIDLSKHKGGIAWRHLTAPFSPGELLAPAGLLLGGLFTHILPQVPLGKSLFDLTNKMIPRVEYTEQVDKDGKRRQVALVKQEWGTWGDVGKAVLQSKAFYFGAGLSLLALLGAPVLVGAAAAGLSVGAFNDYREKGEALDKNIAGLKGAKLDEMRELRKKQLTNPNSLTDEEKEKIAKFRSEFGGMSLGAVLKKFEVGQLAGTREVEDLDQRLGTSANNFGAGKDKDRVDELRTAFGLTGLDDRNVLSHLLNPDGDVAKERQRLRKQEVEGFSEESGLGRLLKLDGAEDLTAPEKAEKKALEQKEVDGTITKDETKRKEELSKKEDLWKERQKVEAIFEVPAGSGLARTIADRNSGVKASLEEYRTKARGRLKRELADSTELDEMRVPSDRFANLSAKKAAGTLTAAEQTEVTSIESEYGKDIENINSIDFFANLSAKKTAGTLTTAEQTEVTSIEAKRGKPIEDVVTDEQDRLDQLKEVWGYPATTGNDAALVGIGADVSAERERRGMPTTPQEFIDFHSQREAMRLDNQQQLKKDQTLLDYTSGEKRQGLRRDIAEYEEMSRDKNDATMTDPDFNAKYKKFMRDHDCTRADILGKKEQLLTGEYGKDMNNLSVGAMPLDRRLRALETQVNTDLSIVRADDEKNYCRAAVLANTGGLNATQKLEFADLRAHLNREGSDKKHDLEASVSFRADEEEGYKKLDLSREAAEASAKRSREDLQQLDGIL